MKKTALITGGTRGIGFGIARCLAREGFDLAINGVREESQVEDPLGELRHLGAEVLYCRGNVADPAVRADILHQVRSHFGKLNVLVNNAGMAPRERRDILEATEESFEEVLHTNMMSAFFLSQQAARWMIEQKQENPGFEGSIVNISSISATLASTNRPEYCIAKAGMSMATKLYAIRLAEYDIPVFEIRPGVISTDMTAGVRDKYDRLISEGLCVQKRWGLPRDVGMAVASLVRGDFPYSTGQVIMVDGGLTLPRL
jgi:3-oxoacyl-[acyl-carrier protein] reductase